LGDVSASARIVRNSTYLTLAYIVQKLLSFGFFVYYSRTIDYLNTGKFVFAVSFTAIFGILVDLGLNPVLIREIARFKERAQTYLSSVLLVKSFLALIGYGAIVLVINLLDYPNDTRQLVYLAGIVMVLESFTLTIFAVFRGFQNFKYEAIGTIIFQIMVMATGVVGLILTNQVIVLGYAVIIGAASNFLFALWNLFRRTAVRLKLFYDRSTIFQLLKTAWPFFIAGVFTKLYAYIDIVLLSIISGESYVGWYSVAYKLTYAIQFFPIAVSNSLYPAFSKFFLDSKERLSGLFEQSSFFMLGVSLPIALGVSFMAQPIVTNPHLWPSYLESVPALRISILGLPFIFISFICSSLLNACNRQKINTINIGIALLINTVANFLLIPAYQHVGASIAALAGSIVLSSLGLSWVYRINPYSIKKILVKLSQGLLASIIMLIPIYFLRASLSIFSLIPLSVISYLVVYFLVGGYKISDLRLIAGVLLKKNQGV